MEPVILQKKMSSVIERPQNFTKFLESPFCRAFLSSCSQSYSKQISHLVIVFILLALNMHGPTETLLLKDYYCNQEIRVERFPSTTIVPCEES